MGSDGFSPVGLRVLVVDGDILSMSNLVKHLTESNYLVTTCNKVDDALKMLKHTEIAIVMTDVNMEDNINEGFEFLANVAQEFDVPVILMTANGDTDIVKRGIRGGACGYLQKPIADKDVRFIWQHAFRKRELGETSQGGNGFNGDSGKRVRNIWTEELHIQFLNAIAQIESSADKRLGHKKILDRMKEQVKELSLTEQQVASHLQKHRGKNSGVLASQVPNTNTSSMYHQNTLPADEPMSIHQNTAIGGNPTYNMPLPEALCPDFQPSPLYPALQYAKPDTYFDSEEYLDLDIDSFWSSPNNDEDTFY